MPETVQNKTDDEVFELLGRVEALGKMENTVKISDGFIINLSTISAEEEAASFAATSGFEGMDYIFQHKRETLARAIKGVNGKKFNYDSISDKKARKESKKEAIDKLKELMGEWREEVISFLYNEFLKLTGNAEDQLKKLGLIAENEMKKKLQQIASDMNATKEEVEEAEEKKE